MPKKYKLKKARELPAGKYYIGDFCYLQRMLKEDSISYLLIQAIFEELNKSGMFEDEQTGVKFYYCNNFGGDGLYHTYIDGEPKLIHGKHKSSVAVDSSSIGAFPYPHASEFKSKSAKASGPRIKVSPGFMKRNTLTRTFKDDFTCSEVTVSAGSYKGTRRLRAPTCVNECEIGDVTIVFDNFQ